MTSAFVYATFVTNFSINLKIEIKLNFKMYYVQKKQLIYQLKLQDKKKTRIGFKHTR